jgi:pyridoxamine 5'-phosphate oxidase
MSLDPIAEFSRLFAQAAQSEPLAGTPCSLATATPDGRPSVRIVLLKSVDARGFSFFTNYESRKAQELAQNPRAALCFHWPSLEHQVRVEGSTSFLSRPESEEYFATRPRDSQIGAWASRQSATLASRDELLERFTEVSERFQGQPVPCPPHWGGYRLTPERLEFWRSRDFRLHERTLYERSCDGWTVRQLYP